MPKGSESLTAVPLEAIGRVERGSGGVLDCGTAEEDGPVTWEAPERPAGRYRATETRRSSPTRRRQQAVRRPASRWQHHGAQNLRLPYW